MLQNIPLKSILIEDRIREDFGDLQSLINSIKESGVIQPLAVMLVESDKYKLLAGERRFRACQELGYTEVPVNIMKNDMTFKEQKIIELSENLYRKDFTWQEEITLKKRIFEAKKDLAKEQRQFVSQGTIAQSVGDSPQNFGRDIKLAEAIQSIPEIAQAKNKHEAMKVMDSLMEKLILDELSERKEKKTLIDTNHLTDLYQLGDALDGMSALPANSYDFIEIDPPYGIEFESIKKGEFNLKEYQEVSIEQYPIFLNTVLSEAFRILKPNRFAILWFGVQWYQVIRDIATENGWAIDNIPCIWNKINGSFQNLQPKKNFSSSYEAFFVLRKGSPSLVTNAPVNVFNAKQMTSKNKEHVTEKPIELIEDILRNFLLPQYKVLSPFLGSGNTIIASFNLGHLCRGWDLSDTHRKRFLAKIISKNFKSYNMGEQ